MVIHTSHHIIRISQKKNLDNLPSALQSLPNYTCHLPHALLHPPTHLLPRSHHQHLPIHAPHPHRPPTTSRSQYTQSPPPSPNPSHWPQPTWPNIPNDSRPAPPSSGLSPIDAPPNNRAADYVPDPPGFDASRIASWRAGTGCGRCWLRGEHAREGEGVFVSQRLARAGAGDGDAVYVRT